MQTMSAKAYASLHQSEDELQESICAWLDIYAARGLLRYWSTPNELPRPGILVKLLGKEMVNRIYAMIGAALNRRGRKAGAPDITIQMSNGPAIYVECKAYSGRLTPPQKDFRDWFNRAGCLWVCARTLDDVINVVTPQMERR